MKKGLKYLISTCIATSLIMASTLAYAETQKNIEVTFGGVKLVVNGKNVEKETILYNGTTYVPLRDAAEALEKEVSYDESSKTAYIIDKGSQPASANTSKPTPTTQSVKSTRKNPLKLNETGYFDGEKSYSYNFKVELTMTEVVRGEEAAALVAQGNKYNKPAPEGKEYMLVKFKIKALESKDDEKVDISNALFDFVSASGVMYDDYTSITGLKPELPEMYVGAEKEGWAYQLIDKGDTPSIVFLEHIDNGVWFATSQ